MNDDISSLFGGGNNSPIEILKQLLSPENVVIKSQVGMEQIRVLLKIKWFAELKKPENADKPVMEIFQEHIIPYYLSLMCSLDRQSRTEILESIKQLSEKFIEKQEGMIPGMMGGK